jgi:hypothetical protein
MDNETYKGATDQYNEMRARLYMSQHPEATFEQALHEVTKPYEPIKSGRSDKF